MYDYHKYVQLNWYYIKLPIMRNKCEDILSNRKFSKTQETFIRKYYNDVFSTSFVFQR